MVSNLVSMFGSGPPSASSPTSSSPESTESSASPNNNEANVLRTNNDSTGAMVNGSEQTEQTRSPHDQSMMMMMMVSSSTPSMYVLPPSSSSSSSTANSAGATTSPSSATASATDTAYPYHVTASQLTQQLFSYPPPHPMQMMSEANTGTDCADEADMVLSAHQSTTTPSHRPAVEQHVHHDVDDDEDAASRDLIDDEVPFINNKLTAIF